MGFFGIGGHNGRGRHSLVLTYVCLHYGSTHDIRPRLKKIIVGQKPQSFAESFGPFIEGAEVLGVFR